jgi:hypothetical protein
VQLTLGGGVQDVSQAAVGQWREDLRTVHQDLVTLVAPQAFFDAEYWLRIVQWLGGTNTKVIILDELRKYLAFIAAKPGRHRDLKRGFRNWLSKAQYYEEERDARNEIQKRRERDRRAEYPGRDRR